MTDTKDFVSFLIAVCCCVFSVIYTKKFFPRQDNSTKYYVQILSISNGKLILYLTFSCFTNFH